LSKAVVIKDLNVMVSGRRVLENFSLDVDVGSVICITGPTGSGKSTLLKVIAGIIPDLYPLFKVSGHVSVFGMDPRSAVRNGLVAYIPQDPTSYFIGSTVEEELSFTKDLREGYGIVSDFLNDTARNIHELSDGQLYRLLIATSVGTGVKVLLLDEPTSHVDPWCLREVLELLMNYCLRYQASVIIVDHRVGLIKDFVDYVVRIDGEYVGNVDLSPLLTVSNGASYIGDVLIKVKDLSFTYDGVRYLLNNVDLEVRAGEAVVLAGRNGVGKTTLIKLIAGVLSPTRGRVRSVKPIFMIPQTPTYWFSQDTVRNEVRLYAKLCGFRGSVDEVLKLFYLSHVSGLSPYSLSVGEARRLSLALAYVSGARVLLLDEPTLGLDHASKLLLVKVLHTLLSRGSAAVITTHDLELVKYFNNVYVLKDGSVEVMNRVPTLVA